MRAQLLAHALQARGVDVQVLTTSDEGAAFLAGFGVQAPVLSRHYAVQFDAAQNMRRQATDANVAAYLFHPGRVGRDVVRLRSWLQDADLVVNDSFHPALLLIGCLPRWRHKVVHVHGDSLRKALETHFDGRWPRWLASLYRRAVAWQIDSARACVTHDFARPEPTRQGRSHGLPTPVAVVEPPEGDVATPTAAVYLNPHFRDPAFAQALEEGLAGAALASHRVGEGYPTRPGWVAQDTAWVERAAVSELIVSAPGMAALSVALVYQRPLLLVVTEQPEQQLNAARAQSLGLRLRTVVWRGDRPAFAQAVQQAVQALRAPPAAESGLSQGRGVDRARARLQVWVDVLCELAQPQAGH
ncbi:MAG: hypothetical protein V4739_07895 [Pseudomonadota bacterium]